MVAQGLVRNIDERDFSSNNHKNLILEPWQHGNLVVILEGLVLNIDQWEFRSKHLKNLFRTSDI